MSNLVVLLNCGAGISGLFGAGLWFWASRAPVAAVGGGHFPITDSEGFTPRTREMARKNMWAALMTGLSVLLSSVAQLLSTWMPTCAS